MTTEKVKPNWLLMAAGGESGCWVKVELVPSCHLELEASSGAKVMSWRRSARDGVDGGGELAMKISRDTYDTSK